MTSNNNLLPNNTIYLFLFKENIKINFALKKKLSKQKKRIKNLKKINLLIFKNSVS